jgi:hypothetical protein
MRVSGQRHVPAALPAERDMVHVGNQGRSGRVRKISLSLGFDLRNAQLAASRCANYDIPAYTYRWYLEKKWPFKLNFNFISSVLYVSYFNETAVQ